MFTQISLIYPVWDFNFSNSLLLATVRNNLTGHQSLICFNESGVEINRSEPVPHGGVLHLINEHFLWTNPSFETSIVYNSTSFDIEKIFPFAVSKQVLDFNKFCKDNSYLVRIKKDNVWCWELLDSIKLIQINEFPDSFFNRKEILLLIDKNRLIDKIGSVLRCRALNDGSIIWQINVKKINGNLESTITHLLLSAESLICSISPNLILSISVESGRIIWQLSLPNYHPWPSGFFIDEQNFIQIISQFRQQYTVEINSGKLLSTLDFKNIWKNNSLKFEETYSEAQFSEYSRGFASHNQNWYITTMKGWIGMVDSKTGQINYAQKISDESIITAPSFWKNRILIKDSENYLFILSL